jgi:hypothetical protein
MNPALSRELLVAIGHHLSLPPAWRDAAARTTAAAERLALVRPLKRRLLVATVHGRRRLRAWIDQQRLIPSTPTPPWLVPGLVRERVLYFGDVSILNVVIEALVRVPVPVRCTGLADAVFLGVGVESCAWTGSSNLRDSEGEGRPRIVVLGPTVDVVKVAHELGHLWHAPPPHRYAQLVSVRGEERLLALAAREGWLSRAEDHIARGELLADACAYAWT